MQIHIISIGTKMPDWIKQGFNEYAKRMPASCSINLVEIESIQRIKNVDTKHIIELDSERLLKAVPKNNKIIALDTSGKMLNTETLSEQLHSWMQTGQDISLLIGGPDGLSSQCLQTANMKWSLSPLTFPHMLVRVIVAEQLYRAWSILKNHPYHRG